MNYSLSFCEITQIGKNIFEVIDNEGIILDNKCVEEVSKFWTELRQEPFGLLVNCQNSFSYSFEGLCGMGIHPLQKNTAIFINNRKQEKAVQTSIEVKRALDISYHHKIFHDRNKAIEWLRCLD